MHGDSGSNWRRLRLILLMTLVLAIPCLGASGPSRSVAGQTAAALPPVDLAALLPGILDLESAGIAGMAGSDPVDLDSVDAYLTQVGSTDPAFGDGLAAAGFVRHYGVTWLDDASETAYRESATFAPLTSVEIFGIQFGDPAGAAAGFALLAGAGTPIPDVAPGLGDESVAGEYPPVTYADGSTGTGANLMVRTGAMTFGVAIVTQETSPVRGSELAIATRLLTAIVNRIAPPAAPPTTGPGLEAVRFAGTTSGYATGFYTYRDGWSWWSYVGESAEVREGYTAEEIATGVVSQYAVYQVLETPSASFYGFYSYATAYQTPELARAAVTDATLPADGFEVTLIDGAPVFGDGSVAYTLVGTDGATFESYLTWSAGASVYTIRIELGNRVAAPATLYALATAQASCLATATCWQYQTLPVDVIADASALA